MVAEATNLCGSSGWVLTAYWDKPGYFPLGTQLCNTWSNVVGRPCETVE